MMDTFFLSVALKGAVALGLAWGTERLFRRASASARHGVWAAAFAALLLLPAWEWAGPAWTVPVLPAGPSERVAEPTRLEASPAPVQAPPTPTAPASEADAAPAAADQPVPPPFPAPSSTFEWEDEGAETQPFWTALSPAAWLLGCWALGVLAVALVWLSAFGSARRLVQAAAEERDPAWLALAGRLRRQIGLSGRVQLLRSDRLDVPIAWGYGRGAVVLPAAADAWPAEQREAVLLHELAHLRRRDAWTQVVAQAALALHWFNPLAWRAYRAFLTAREQACDDAVLTGGTRPSAYAAHLVGVAREIRREPLALAAVAPMARPNALEGRVLSVLDADRRRGPLGRRRLATTLLVGLGVLTPLAAFQPAERALAGDETAQDATPPAPPAPPDAERLTIREAEGDVGEAQQRLQRALQQVEDVHRRVEAAHLWLGAVTTPAGFAEARAELDAAQQEWIAVQDTLSAAQESLQQEVLARFGASDDEEQALRGLERAVREAIDPGASPAPAPRPRASAAPDAVSSPPVVDWDAIDRARRAALRND